MLNGFLSGIFTEEAQSHCGLVLQWRWENPQDKQRISFRNINSLKLLWKAGPLLMDEVITYGKSVNFVLRIRKGLWLCPYWQLRLLTCTQLV